MASILPAIRKPAVPPKAAAALLGLKLPYDWQVTEKLKAAPGATGGNFSVGYIVEKDGRRAFLKALDYSRALRSSDPARALQALTEAYNFERDILAKCRGMSRVVTAIADGSVTVNISGTPEVVQYLILERADGDARSFLNASASFDMAWALRSLHHIAIGLRQMHQENMAHQDLKPSNVLIFGKNSSKIGDVGRAWYKGSVSPHEGLACAGDPAYAPPESLYGHADPDSNARRMGCDCYLLGSMVLFFFTNVAATPAILAKMLPSHHPTRWRDAYARVLPFVRDAFDRVAIEFSNSLSPDLRKDLPTIFRQLCDPDPRLRGHPADRASIGNSYSLLRYEGKFNTLAGKAEFKLIN
jgi:serine/threonine protein kinase